jgi:Flp pilus assembly protein TadG
MATRQSRLARCERGGVAIEFAIIGSLLVLGCLAIMEFGRGLYLRSELSFAADAAERQMLMNADISDEDIDTTIRSAFSGDADSLTIDMSEETIDGVKFRTVSLSYPMALLMPVVPSGELHITVDRRTPIGLEATPS